MYNEYGDPKAPDYHFVAYYAGGGMHNWHSSPRVTDCTFSGNTAAAAGGMCNLDDSNPIVTSCTFSGNTALNGGGMYNEYSNPSVTGCTFSGNSAPYAGGGVLNKYSDPTVINCSFDGNSVYVFGGGMANEYSSPTLANCTFDQNTVRFGGGGGGMANYRSNPTVTNATFSGNTAPHANGGGICNDDSSSSVTNCTFSGNRAANGAAIACDSVQPQYPSTIELVNCILWDGGDQVWNNDNSSITITFSDVQGGWPNDDCPVEYPDCNFDADPLFVPGPEGCYYLSQTAAGQPIDSPCLDAGSDTAENLALDTLTTRSDEVGDAGVVDMGYHYPVTGQPLIMGDYNRDLVVDLADFAALQNCFTGEGPTDVTPCCRIFDFEPDNDVDLDDYDQFEVAFNP
jgi:predicted outer membrane repeat protein